MVDLGTVQLLCNTSEKGGGVSKNMILYYMGGKGGGLERGQIVLHNNWMASYRKDLLIKVVL